MDSTQTLLPVTQLHTFANNSAILEHLNNVSYEDSSLSLNYVVNTYVAISRAWHKAINVVMAELCSSSRTKNLNRILESYSDCTKHQYPPPPFLVGFEHDFLHSWTRAIVGCVVSHGGCEWSFADQQELSDSLKSMLDMGLCHRQHVTLVQAGKNTAWLAEYVTCILAIWREGEGRATPETVQCFKKLACCTPEAMALICDYSRVVLSNVDVEQVESTLTCVQKVVYSSFGQNGVSNTSAAQCISYLKIHKKTFVFLEEVKNLLDNVWDLLTNPRFVSGECTCLPGIAGSHVEEFAIPSVVVKKGCTKTVLNCIMSALPLSFVNPSVDHFVAVASTSKSFSCLRYGVVECLESMLLAERFGGDRGCSTSWWEEYKRLTRGLIGKACEDLGIEQRSNDSPLAPLSVSLGTSMFSELQVQRDHFMTSKVTKVLVAGNLFDQTFKIAMSGQRNARVRVADFYTIHDPKSGCLKADPSLAGRLLSDLQRVAKELGIQGDVIIEPKCVVYTSRASAAKMLNLLVQYMKEHSKSRRKKGDSVFLKRNVKPDYDGRKKQRRPHTPGSVVAESWVASDVEDEPYSNSF